MTEFEIFQKLPQCDTQTQSEQIQLENGTHRLAQCGVTTDLRFVKNAISQKQDKVKHNKTRYVCIVFIYSIRDE